LPERGGALRLCVVGLSDGALLEYLRAVEWPGSASRLACALARAARAMGACPAAAILHLDIDDRVRARIGLEYVLARRPQMHRELAERALLDHLGDAGLCAPAKREALLQWPGWSIEALPHELWESLIGRRVNHIKVMYEGGEPVEAKAYLCFTHRFWSRRRSTE
jgi:hypothetical protein